MKKKKKKKKIEKKKKNSLRVGGGGGGGGWRWACFPNVGTGKIRKLGDGVYNNGL